MAKQNTELKTNLFEDLSDEQLQTVVGGTGVLQSTEEGAYNLQNTLLTYQFGLVYGATTGLGTNG